MIGSGVAKDPIKEGVVSQQRKLGAAAEAVGSWWLWRVGTGPHRSGDRMLVPAKRA